MAGKVTAGLVESKGSPPPALTNVTCRLTVKKLGWISCVLNVLNRVWDSFFAYSGKVAPAIRPLAADILRVKSCILLLLLLLLMHKEIFMVSETVDTTALNSHQVYSNN